jgi:hypothetical protein
MPDFDELVADPQMRREHRRHFRHDDLALGSRYCPRARWLGTPNKDQKPPQASIAGLNTSTRYLPNNHIGNPPMSLFKRRTVKAPRRDVCGNIKEIGGSQKSKYGMSSNAGVRQSRWR